MSTAMSIHTLLARLLFLTLPSALIALLYLYNYPLFHHDCAFPLPPPSSSAASVGVDGHAPFRLLLLADPQLEGDTSLPHPDYTLSKRVRRYWADIKLSAADTVRRRKEEVIIDQDGGEQAAPLHTTLLTTLTTLLTADIPRSLEAARKRIDLLGNDFYLAHIYRTLHAYTAPTHVAVLGDLLGSQWISDHEFARRTRRYWRRVFRGAERVGDEWMVGGEEDGGEGKVVDGIGKKG
ncbi:hypothetical protein KEM56_004373 [Ascosphaera pollenicola]|nr:hypothetical protein KEM56_004373 [Ascosphaera pollenicola]